MNLFLSLGLIIGGTGLVSSLFALNWFRKKELSEKRTLDLKILALDHQLMFDEDDKALNELLQSNYIGYQGRDTVTHNVITKKHPHGVSTLFDYSYQAGRDQKQTVTVKAILLEFENQKFPVFEIARRSKLNTAVLESIDDLDGLQTQVPYDIAILASPGQYDTIRNLLERNPIINSLVCLSKFSAMCFYGSYIVIYFDRSYPAEQPYFQEMLDWKDALLRIKMTGEEENELTQLKRIDQNQNNLNQQY